MVFIRDGEKTILKEWGIFQSFTYLITMRWDIAGGQASIYLQKFWHGSLAEIPASSAQ